jgi:hypothetical protein
VSLPVEDRVRALVEEAKALLGSGLSNDAADIFGRVLLLDPRHLEASRGLDQARELSAEKQRRLEACLEDASRAADTGRNDVARQLAEQALRDGGDAGRAQTLLDRVDDRAGRLDSLGGILPTEGRIALRAPLRRPAPVSRQALVAAWTLAFVTMAVGLAFSWDRLVGDLVSAPAPESPSIMATAPEADVTAGAVAVSRARELVARGDLATALVILDEVSPADAEYPFARRLRSQVSAALTGGSGR